MTTPSFWDARRVAQAIAKPTVRDQVRAHLKDIRKAREDGDSWAVIAETLANLGIRWKSGTAIDGAALCRMVGDVERLDHGIRRPVGRPGRTQPSAGSVITTPRLKESGTVERCDKGREDGIRAVPTQPFAASVPDRNAEVPDYEHRLLEPHQRRKAAPPVRKISD